MFFILVEFIVKKIKEKVKVYLMKEFFYRDGEKGILVVLVGKVSVRLDKGEGCCYESFCLI